MVTRQPDTARLPRLALSCGAGLLLAACTSGAVSGHAPLRSPGGIYVFGPEAHQGPQGWDGTWNPAWTGVEQPGDLFGGEDVASVDVFIEPLAPYGRWLQTRWGLAFRPDVPPDWRPYVNGRWTEYRLWISDDPWGWATDHYGRWAHDAALGWVWVPGTKWGPHWVAFRENAQMAGWAPIPPGVDFNIGVGFGGGYRGWGFNDWNSWYGPGWVWAPASVIFLPGLRQHVLPPVWGPTHWQQTRWQHWTPWRPDRGWAGAPGRNYWRGPAPSPVSTRIGTSLARRADLPGLPAAAPGLAESDPRREPDRSRRWQQGGQPWQWRGRPAQPGAIPADGDAMPRRSWQADRPAIEGAGRRPVPATADSASPRAINPWRALSRSDSAIAPGARPDAGIERWGGRDTAPVAISRDGESPAAAAAAGGTQGSGWRGRWSGAAGGPRAEAPLPSPPVAAGGRGAAAIGRAPSPAIGRPAAGAEARRASPPAISRSSGLSDGSYQEH